MKVIETYSLYNMVNFNNTESPSYRVIGANSVLNAFNP